MTEHKVSSRYALAALNTAKELGLADALHDDFIFLKSTLKTSRELRLLMSSPVVYHWQKKKAIKEIFEGKICELSLNFLLLLAEKGREKLITDIFEEYFSQFDAYKNRIRVDITTARGLSDDMKKDVVGKIEANANKTVISNFIVDESLKGGIQIQINDQVFDASLKRQLELLRVRLSTGEDAIKVKM